MKTGWYTIYTPVLQEGKDNSFFTVNCSQCIDKDTAIRRANKHRSIASGSAKIVRVDEEKVHIDEWTSDNSFILPN